MSTGTRTRSRWEAIIRACVVPIGVICALFFGAGVWFSVLVGRGPDESLTEAIVLSVALYAYLAVGLVLLRKLPRNPLGWTMTAVGFLTSVGTLATSYSEYALAPPGHDVPLATFAAWINSWWWFPTITMVFLFVPLLFPNGTPLTPRWRWLTRASVGLLIGMLLTAPLNPELAGEEYRVANPIGVAAVGDIEESVLGSVVFFVLLACTVLALISQILRFRRSRGVERQQMKWFVFGCFVIISLTLVEELAKVFGFAHIIPDSNIVFGFAVALLPVTIGLAALKYRLYDIDRIISRTLSYGLLSAVLLALYLGAVTGLTTLTAPVTRESTPAVAAATLLAAAAFGPARRRIQSVVDRRFNRARYDAARTIDQFRSHLRDELDLASITASVQDVVDDTVQPSRVVVWLRQEVV